MPSINQFLEEFGRQLRLDPVAQKRAVEEARDHLLQVTEKHVRDGMMREQAETLAVQEFGRSDAIAQQIMAESPVLKFVLLVGVSGMLLVAAWLVGVIFWVLPNGNTDEIPFWTVVAAGFAGYGFVALWYLLGRANWLRPIIILSSLLAVIGGAAAFVHNYLRAIQTEDFEGYLFLMSLALIGFGLLNALYAWRRRPLAKT